MLGVLGGLFAAVVCIRQVDMKLLVAYASVSHIRLTVRTIIVIRVGGWVATKIMLIAHGLSRSGLFALANFFYENTGSRNLIINKGIIHLVPRLRM